MCDHARLQLAADSLLSSGTTDGVINAIGVQAAIKRFGELADDCDLPSAELLRKLSHFRCTDERNNGILHRLLDHVRAAAEAPRLFEHRLLTLRKRPLSPQEVARYAAVLDSRHIYALIDCLPHAEGCAKLLKNAVNLLLHLPVEYGSAYNMRLEAALQQLDKRAARGVTYSDAAVYEMMGVAGLAIKREQYFTHYLSLIFPHECDRGLALRAACARSQWGVQSYFHGVDAAWEYFDRELEQKRGYLPLRAALMIAGLPDCPRWRRRTMRDCLEESGLMVIAQQIGLGPVLDAVTHSEKQAIVHLPSSSITKPFHELTSLPDGLLAERLKQAIQAVHQLTPRLPSLPPLRFEGLRKQGVATAIMLLEMLAQNYHTYVRVARDHQPYDADGSTSLAGLIASAFAAKTMQKRTGAPENTIRSNPVWRWIKQEVCLPSVAPTRSKLDRLRDAQEAQFAENHVHQALREVRHEPEFRQRIEHTHRRYREFHISCADLQQELKLIVQDYRASD